MIESSAIPWPLFTPYEHCHADVKVTMDFCIALGEYNMKAKPMPVMLAHFGDDQVLMFSALAELSIGGGIDRLVFL